MLAKYRRRILELADFIDQGVSVEHFDMSAWFWNHNEDETLRIAPRSVMIDVGGWTAEELAELKKRGSWVETPKEAAKSCGTAACIAGWLALSKPRSVTTDTSCVAGQAGRYLGLDPHVANHLFVPPGLHNVPEGEPTPFTKDNAVKALRKLAETGQVPTWWSYEA